MKNKYSITIGIPAYNEAHNIGRLLTALLAQNIADQISEILVYSDASSDNTVIEAKKIHDKRIKVIDQPLRLGKNATLNNLFHKATGSIFVQLDADVIPSDIYVLANIISPIINSNADLVAAHVSPLHPKTYIEYFTTFGHMFRTAIYQRLHDQDNVYLCYGRARAFSKILLTTKFSKRMPRRFILILIC